MQPLVTLGRHSHLKCVEASNQMQHTTLTNKREGCLDLLKQDTALQKPDIKNCLLEAKIAAWEFAAFKDAVVM